MGTRYNRLFFQIHGKFSSSWKFCKEPLNAIKEFCYFVGYQKILQTDKRMEYNNNWLENFCKEL